ncbi:MAG TPA: beta-N-acetylhexosaminidase [Polyangiaceae bacterium]|nr:beta-N-acetylhexosaminidase [Polyangiaceae bacterium]
MSPSSFRDAERFTAALDLESLCGQVLVVGFDGTSLPRFLADHLCHGRRGGVILFRRNLSDLEGSWQLCREIRNSFASTMPPLIAIDEEGGRVTRLPSPFKPLPPMQWLGAREAEVTRRAARWLGRRLAAVGVTWDFAPVLDVDSNPDNPVIGDRSFSSDPAVVARHGLSVVEGLGECGIAACGKHFPGHGDTTLDSHLELPTVQHSAERLNQVEFFPFRACATSQLAGMMTAHVSYPGLDASGTPATFSPIILQQILREQLGFSGVLFSDDLEMGAVVRHHRIEDAACQAIRAGCDALLVCHSEEVAERAHAALVAEAKRDATILNSLRKAVTRLIQARSRRRPVQAHSVGELFAVFDEADRASWDDDSRHSDGR